MVKIVDRNVISHEVGVLGERGRRSHAYETAAPLEGPRFIFHRPQQ